MPTSDMWIDDKQRDEFFILDETLEPSFLVFDILCEFHKDTNQAMLVNDKKSLTRLQQIQIGALQSQKK